MRPILGASTNGSVSLAMRMLILASNGFGNFCRSGVFSGLQTTGGVTQSPARSGSSTVRLLLRGYLLPMPRVVAADRQTGRVKTKTNTNLAGRTDAFCFKLELLAG